MTVTADSFRNHYREFADAAIYADPDITYYIGLAYDFLIADRWGKHLDYGVELWVAHNLVISGIKKEDGDPSAGIEGPVTSQHVGEVGFTNAPQYLLQGLKDAGFYARTSYGLQYFQLANMIGSGGFQA